MNRAWHHGFIHGFNNNNKKRLADAESRATLGHETSMALDKELQAQRKRHEDAVLESSQRLAVYEAQLSGDTGAFREAQKRVARLAADLLEKDSSSSSKQGGRSGKKAKSGGAKAGKGGAGILGGSDDGPLCVATLLAIELNAAKFREVAHLYPTQLAFVRLYGARPSLARGRRRGA